MRGTIIGIVIGVVLGVMVGATVVAPGLNDAREMDTGTDVPGSEKLPIADDTSRITAAAQTSDTKKALRVIAHVDRERPVLGPMAKRLTGGDTNVRLFAPGALVPASDTFQAVASGAVDAVLSTPEDWAPDDPALQIFTAVPFGPAPQEMLAWFDGGGGRALFEKQMEALGVHAVLCGATPAAGSGWFRLPVRAPDDFQGLAVRERGLGARVFEALGAHILRMDAAAIRTGFADATLDGAAYDLPAVDADAELYRHARQYYFPGWQRPVTFYTLAVNTDAWNALPARQRRAVVKTCQANVRLTLSEASAEQFPALTDLGLKGVQIRSWPEPVLETFAKTWATVRRDIAARDPDFAEIWASLAAFRRDYAIWRDLGQP